MSDGVQLAQEASSRDPAIGLRAVRALRELAERLEALQVENARDQGWSWQEIAVCLGVSRAGGPQEVRRGPADPRKGAVAMFERFTDEARLVVRLSQDEARRLGHAFIGTEHLLLAILGVGHGPAAEALIAQGVTGPDLSRRIIRLIAPPEDQLDPEALATIGIDLDQVRQATEASFGPGALEPKARREARKGHIPFTRRAKKVLELALREALALGHNYIGSGHILLGLLREGHGLAVHALANSGVDLDALRADVTRRIPPKAA
ncbi:Clp protease N-terminal domain-containing protein [Actinoallomurus acanthiterrae]